MFEQLMMMNEGGLAAPQDNGKWQGLNYLKGLYANRPWADQVDAANKLRTDRLKKNPVELSAQQDNPWVLMSAQNPEIRDLASAPVPPVATSAPPSAMTPKSASISVSRSGYSPMKNPSPEDDYLAKLQDAFAKQQETTGNWVGEQNNVANTLIGQKADVDFSPVMSYIDSWNNRDTLQKGYSKPQSQEEKLAIVQQLKNGILKAQQGLSEDEMNLFKTLYSAKTDKEKFDAQQKLAWANYGLDKDKLDILRGKSKAGKAPTADQFKAATFGQRAADANAQLFELMQGGYDPTSESAAAQRFLPNAVVGENAKLSDQAERNFINSVLRRESGAAISKSEFSSAEKQYFPRLGDTPEVLAQKEANRQRVIEGLRLESGNAWNMFSNKRFTPETFSKSPNEMTREEKIRFLTGE
jgi:hypothetical protein